MAIGAGGNVTKRKRVPSPATSPISGYLSDESSFYGDSPTKRSLLRRLTSLPIEPWFKNPTITQIANTFAKTEKKMSSFTLSNPYEGCPYARQLGESVEQFLARLPPSTTTQTESLPWIFVANPFREIVKRVDEEGDVKMDMNEGPSGDDSDWGAFVSTGTRALQELNGMRLEFEKRNGGMERVEVARAFGEERDRVVKRLLDEARRLGCTSGKWMLFISASEIDIVWATVARATANNELGTAAKVAPDDGRGRDRLICIYTKDFSDMKDVSRVVHKMKDIGLINAREKPIYYKCDAYTYLSLGSGNPYDIKASLYSSKDVLQAKPDQMAKADQKLDSFFYKRKDKGD